MEKTYYSAYLRYLNRFCKSHGLPLNTIGASLVLTGINCTDYIKKKDVRDHNNKTLERIVFILLNQDELSDLAHFLYLTSLILRKNPDLSRLNKTKLLHDLAFFEAHENERELSSSLLLHAAFDLFLRKT